MPVPEHERMTLEAFLAWEAEQERKYEFVDGRPVLVGRDATMTGATAAHDVIKFNIQVALHRRLRGGSCRTYTSDMRIICGNGNARFPDVTVGCGPFRPMDTAVDDPRVVVEVLSPSTRGQDFLLKLRDYSWTPSIAAYVIVWQDEARSMVYRRSGIAWGVPDEPLGLDAVILLPEIGTELPLAEAYEGLEFGAA